MLWLVLLLELVLVPAGSLKVLLLLLLAGLPKLLAGTPG
jgi:hypothetical protein